MIRSIYFSLHLVFLIAFPANAAISGKPICGPFAKFWNEFIVKGVWQVAATGAIGDTQRFSVWATEAGRFIVIILYKNRGACVFVAGTDYRPFDVKRGELN